MLDLLKIAQTEAEGGDLLDLLGGLYQASEVRPEGHPEAVIWQGGNFDGKTKRIQNNIHPLQPAAFDCHCIVLFCRTGDDNLICAKGHINIMRA